MLASAFAIFLALVVSAAPVFSAPIFINSDNIAVREVDDTLPRRGFFQEIGDGLVDFGKIIGEDLGIVHDDDD